MGFIQTNKGFSLIMALIAIAILGCISLAVATLFNSFNAQSRHFNAVSGARTLISTMQGFIAYPNLCIANLAPSVTTTPFNTTQAATPTGIPFAIRLGDPTPTGVVVQAGSTLQNFDVVVQNLDFHNVTLVGADPAVANNKLYSGELVLKLQKNGSYTNVAGGTELKWRSVGILLVSVNPSGFITGCYALASAQQACNQVGGTYNGATTPPCQLPYPCPANSVFLGYVSGVAQCQTLAQIVGACPSGKYLVSDGMGGTLCAP
ncbi:MAG: type II secretion system protein [Pseudobdellovibrionaceae bacterium]